MLSKNQIREIQSLQLKKIRDQKQLFIAEGAKTVSEILLERPDIVKNIFATEDFVAKNSKNISTSSVSCEIVSTEELKKISLQATPSGALAVCHFIGKANDETKGPTGVSFYLDDIRDPGNFGTIIRLLSWFGHSTLYCSPDCCDRYNPKVIQASMGSFMRIAIQYVSLSDLIANRGFKKVYGAVLDGKSLYQETFESGLVIIGNEANGIHEANLGLLTNKLTIPSANTNGAESLNAAMAASIIAAEIYRQKL